MNKASKQKAIVGMLDILGYVSFLRANKATEAALQVVEMLSLMPAFMQSTALQIAESRGARLVIREVSWQVFADSLIVITPLKEKDSPDQQCLKWLLTIFSTCLATRLMIEAGLPLRGAIDVGECIVAHNCFAGEPIVNAHTLGLDLDASAVVLTDNAYSDFMSLSETSNFKAMKGFIPLFEYAVPRKSGAVTTSHVLRCFSVRLGREHKLPEDVDAFVDNMFSQHGKEMTPSALEKARNTKDLLKAAKWPLNKGVAQPSAEPHRGSAA